MRRIHWLVYTMAIMLPLSAQAVSSATPAIHMAVLGDSDTHGYHDSVAFPEVMPWRGGPYHASTHQWTEILAMLRPAQINLGPPTLTGTRGRMARALELVGIDERSPRRFDHLHNFAYSGSGCEDLWDGNRQVPRLLRLIKNNPEPWQQRGVIVIRIGVKNFGLKTELGQLVANPQDRAVQDQISNCIHALSRSVKAIRAEQPQVRLVLVGIFNNAHLAYRHNDWQNPTELQHIEQALSRFDQALQNLAKKDDQIAFFNDRAWFASIWGSRDAQGKPAYKNLVLGPGLEVTNTIGDHPQNAVLADGHAGTAFNAKWAQAMVALLNQRFHFELTPITDEEVSQVVAPNGHWPEPEK